MRLSDGIYALASTYLSNLLIQTLASRFTSKTVTWLPPPVTWHACPANLLTDTSLSLQCSTVEVPLNYTDPFATKLALPMLRVSASKGLAERSILIEFDNPSVSGRSLLAEWAQILLHLTGGEYNLVAWDNREDHIRPCWNATIQNLAANGSIHACNQGTAAFAALDSLSILQALQEDGKIRYWGFGQAAQSGVSIASYRPDWIERMIIDGTPLAQSWASIVHTENPLLFLSRTDQWRPSWNESLEFTGSVLLRLDGPGQVSLENPSSCALSALTNYWRLGMLPKQGALCPEDGNDMSWEDVFRQSSGEGE